MPKLSVLGKSRPAKQIQLALNCCQMANKPSALAEDFQRFKLRGRLGKKWRVLQPKAWSMGKELGKTNQTKPKMSFCGRGDDSVVPQNYIRRISQGKWISVCISANISLDFWVVFEHPCKSTHRSSSTSKSPKDPLSLTSI